MTSPSASVEGLAVGRFELETSGFRIVNADTRPCIGLESPECESPDKVAHKRARVNPGRRAAASYYISIGLPQREVSAAPKAVVKEVSFNGRTKYACTKDITEFDSAEKADVILWRDLERVSEKS